MGRQSVAGEQQTQYGFYRWKCGFRPRKWRLPPSGSWRCDTDARNNRHDTIRNGVPTRSSGSTARIGDAVCCVEPAKKKKWKIKSWENDFSRGEKKISSNRIIKRFCYFWSIRETFFKHLNVLVLFSPGRSLQKKKHKNSW